MRATIAILAFVIVLAVGGAIILAQAPLTPPIEKVERGVPDGQIPR